ncbi:MAG: sulfatase-like hydrolase/transferase [Myxococcales bacterium]|jgi:arylsulfatase A-like enzyme
MRSWVVRALLAGLGLAGLEIGLVVATDRRLFLSSTELARYAGYATAVACALCLVLAGAFALSLRLLGVGRDAAAAVRRAGRLTAALAWPALGLAAWSLTAGRRVRDLVGREVLVGLLSLAGAVALGRGVRWLLDARRSRGPSARIALGLAVASLVALALDMYVLRRLYPAWHWSLFVASVGAALGAASFVPLARIPPPRAPAPWGALSLGVVAWAAASLSSIADAPNLRFAVEQSAPIAGKLLALAPSPAPTQAPATGVGAPAPDPAATSTSRHTGIDLRGRDVLLITIDALRADRLRAYGGDGLTPAMDALAQESAVFMRAYTPTPHTSYALSSLMTGKLMRPVLALSDDRAEHPTLPQLLRRHGYRTAAFYPPAIFFVDAERFAWLRESHLGFEYVKEMFAPAADRVGQLQRYLARAGDDHPLFVWVHLFEPHEPYEPPAAFARGDSPEARYDGEVAAADAAVRGLVQTFRRARPRGTVVLTADHGEEFGDHGGHHHGTTLFDEQVRVPLLWSSPDVVAAAELDAPVETIDLTTTLLSALGVPREARMRGDDLGALLAGQAGAGPAHAFASIEDQRMATDGRMKLICADGGARCRLFDLVQDPRELRDVSSEHPDAVAALRGAIEEQVASIPRVEALAMRGGGAWPPALTRARLGDATVGPQVVPLLDDPRPEVRAAAARAVGRLGVHAARNVVSRMREADADADVRAEAALSALRLGETEAKAQVQQLLQRDGELGLQAARALAAAGDDRGAGRLLRAVADASLDEAQRVEALEALEAVAGPAQARALVDSLGDVRLRARIARALGRIGAPLAAPALVEALRDEPYPEARAAEIRALLALGQRRAARAGLIRWLGTEGGVPGGLELLLQTGTGAAGPVVRLGDEPAARTGSWRCVAEGCSPGDGAALALPALARAKTPMRVVLHVRAPGSHPARLRLAGQEHWLSPGAGELSTTLEPADRVPVDGDDGVVIDAAVVVPLRTESATATTTGSPAAD